MASSCCCSLLDYPGLVSMQRWWGEHILKSGSLGQMVAVPAGVFKLRHITASACVALVIIAVITPTAPSVARAITKSIVVF